MAVRSWRGTSLLVVGVQMGELGKENWRWWRRWWALVGLRGGESDVRGGDALRLIGLSSDGSSLRSRSRSGGVRGAGPPPDAEWTGEMSGVGESAVLGESPW